MDRLDSIGRSVFNALFGTVGLGIALVYILAVVLERRLIKSGPDEPPMVYSKIPFIGHVYGLLTMGPPAYYSKLYKRKPQPIFGINLLGSTMYIIATPALTSQMQRASKTLIFSPILTVLSQLMNDISDSAMVVIGTRKTTNVEDGIAMVDGHVPKGHYSTHMLNLEDKVHELQGPLLGPGPQLDELSAVQLKSMADSMNALPTGDGSAEVKLFIWLRHLVTVSNMLSIYGPDNIIARDQSLEAEFWNYIAYLPMIMLGPATKLTHVKAWKSLERLQAALAKWAVDGGVDSASPWIKARQIIGKDHGLDAATVSSFEASMMMGVLANAMPATFWALCYIYATPGLVAQLREELSSPDITSETQDPATGGRIKTMSISGLKSQASLLNSTFREVLRLVGPSMSVRAVAEDTVISGVDKQPYLLKKDSICQSIGAIMHFEEDVWGPDASQFVPERFLYNQWGTKTRKDVPAGSAEAEAVKVSPADSEKSGGSSAPQAVHPSAYRSFGGGVSLCPGRHFAAMEITGFVALFVMGFDLERQDGKHFFVPKQKTDDVVPLAIGVPYKDVDAVIKRRAGYEEVTWAFEK